MSGAVVGAVVAKKRREILSAFRSKRATSEDSAMPLSSLGVDPSLLFRAQERRGVVVEVGDGRYYLDEAAVERADRLHRRMVLALVLAVAVALFVVMG